jgi:thiosulfate dehydrogenase
MLRAATPILPVLAALLFACCSQQKPEKLSEKRDADAWTRQDTINYGRAILLNTAAYFGPEGKIAPNSLSRMSCTNCHRDAGTRSFGLNFYATWKRYPRFRGRENRFVELHERINYCFERSLNGKPIPKDGREMKSLLAYIHWVNENYGQIGETKATLALPEERLDPEAGKKIYVQQCVRCHGEDGQGKLDPAGKTYLYPPLWGDFSYRQGAGMHRIITAAEFIRMNMPEDQSSPTLSDMEAFQVAAYINSRELKRPENKFNDYPDASKKPVDYPFGPYTDSFPEDQHKYGPFLPIIEKRGQ